MYPNYKPNLATARWFILGGGSVTAEYYLPAFRLLDALDQVIVVDPDAEAIKAQFPRFADVDYRAQNFADFLGSLSAKPSGQECVIVALPNQLHAEAARRALERGRDVLCEKPLALTKSDCRQLKEIASAGNRLLKVAMVRRYLPSLMLAHEIVEGNELGAVHSIEVRDSSPFLWRPRSFSFFAPEAGGVLADMGVHYLDWLDTLIGPMRPVSYKDDARGGIESTAEFLLSGPFGDISIHLSRVHRTGAYVRIRCDRGEICINKSHDSEVLLRPNTGLVRSIRCVAPFDSAVWPGNLHGCFCQMISDMDRELSGLPTPIADVVDAERVAGLIEWAYRSRAIETKSRLVSTPVRDKVVVTGATGFIGGHLIDRLSHGLADVIATVRSPSSCANIARHSVDIRPVNLLDPSSVRAAINGARIVHHLACGNGGSDPASTTIDGTKNVIDAAIETGAECVVVLSTMYVFGFPRELRAVDETFPYRPYGGEYGKSKTVMEKWVLKRAKTSLPTRIVVLNPTCVYGPAGGAYTSLPVDLAREGRFCWIDGGFGSANYVYVENLVDAILAAARTPEAHGQRFIISDGVTTWRKLLGPFVEEAAPRIPSHSLEQLGRLPRYGGAFHLSDLIKTAVSAPDVRNVLKRSKLARRAFATVNRIWPRPPVGARPARELAPVGGCNQGDPPEWLGQLYPPLRATFSAAKARAILGWEPKISLSEGQARTIEWLHLDGRLLPYDRGAVVTFTLAP